MAYVEGVTFDSIHSYRDFGLFLKDIRIELPEVQKASIAVPGMMGLLDLSESQYGGVKFKNRKLTFVFDARDCNYDSWPYLLNMIAMHLHGRKRKITLDIDTSYFYAGRCEVETLKSNEVSAEITVTCDCDPLKMSIRRNGSGWQWDPSNYIDGVVNDLAGIAISTPNSWTDVGIYGWAFNELLEIRCSAAMQIQAGGETYQLTTGTNILSGYTVTEGLNTLKFKGNGTVKVIQRGGTL